MIMEIQREARLENLPALRRFAVGACRQCGADAAACDAVELAVDEACSNIVLHGYDGREPGPIVVTFECRADEAVITIADFGQPFAPDKLPPPDLASGWEERRVGGLGWHLIQQMMDEVTYQTDAQAGNRLTLRKRWQAGG